MILQYFHKKRTIRQAKRMNRFIIILTLGNIYYTIAKKATFWRNNFPNHLLEMHNIINSVEPYGMTEEEWENYAIYSMKYHYRWVIYQRCDICKGYLWKYY